jgi:hypothetical protein
MIKQRLPKAINAHSPQTVIILKSMIPPWIKNNSTDEVKYKFHESEFNRVKSIIQKYTSEYEAPSR